ncbi:MAG: hypothetical protein ACLFNQ_08290 [Spirochaetaceae bacterium]
MVARRFVHAMLACGVVLGLFAGRVPAVAQDARVQSRVQSQSLLLWNQGDDEPSLFGDVFGEIDLQSTRDRAVQGRLTVQLRPVSAGLEGSGTPTIVTSVPRASVRFRLPVTEGYTMRLTSGIDRVAWGAGRVFNAADVIFGSAAGDGADFLAVNGDVRDETALLTALYLPLGGFAYVEPVVLPPLPQVDAATGALALPPASETRAGARVNFELGRFTFEPGYLYTPDAHEAVFSASGLIGIDVYGAARLRLPDAESQYSAGAYHRFRLGRDTSLDLRLEALFRPDESEWVLLYPEAVLSPGRTVSVIARSLVSPVEGSADSVLAVNWAVLGGLDLLAAGVFAHGGSGEGLINGDGGAAGLGAILGLEYRF